MTNPEEYICPICRQEYDPPIHLTARVECACGAEADTNILVEFNQALALLREWQKAISGRAFVTPETEYIDWFVNLNRTTNSFLSKEEWCPNTVYHYHVEQGIEPDGNCMACQKKEVNNEST